MGDNTNNLIGKDPGIGSRDSHILSEHLVQNLNDQGYFYLHWVSNRAGFFGMQTWKDANELHFGDHLAQEWSHYTKLLRQCLISLSPFEDTLVWSYCP